MNYTLRTLILFLLVTFIGYTISMLSDHLLLTNDLVIRDLSKSYTNDEISSIIERKNNGTILFLIARFFYKLIVITIISSIISIGIILNELNVKWIRITNIVIVSSLVFLIPSILKIFWFLFIQKDYTYEEFKNFNILSTYSIIGSTEEWLDNALKQLNIFEAFFWILLSYKVSKLYNITWDRGMLIIASSYGTSFILWLVISIYLNIF